jgi:hypothetical protein
VIYLAVESVVEPGDDRADDEDRDATVVEPAEQAADIGRMTGQGVEQGRTGLKKVANFSSQTNKAAFI